MIILLRNEQRTEIVKVTPSITIDNKTIQYFEVRKIYAVSLDTDTALESEAAVEESQITPLVGKSKTDLVAQYTAEVNDPNASASQIARANDILEQLEDEV